MAAAENNKLCCFVNCKETDKLKGTNTSMTDILSMALTDLGIKFESKITQAKEIYNHNCNTMSSTIEQLNNIKKQGKL